MGSHFRKTAQMWNGTPAPFLNTQYNPYAAMIGEQPSQTAANAVAMSLGLVQQRGDGSYGYRQTNPQAVYQTMLRLGYPPQQVMQFMQSPAIARLYGGAGAASMQLPGGMDEHGPAAQGMGAAPNAQDYLAQLNETEENNHPGFGYKPVAPQPQTLPNGLSQAPTGAVGQVMENDYVPFPQNGKGRGLAMPSMSSGDAFGNYAQQAVRMAARAQQMEAEGQFDRADRIDALLARFASDEQWADGELDWSGDDSHPFLATLDQYIEKWSREYGMSRLDSIRDGLPPDTEELLGDGWQTIAQALEARYNGNDMQSGANKLNAFSKFVRGVREAPPGLYSAILRDIRQGFPIYDAIYNMGVLSRHFTERHEQLSLLAAHATPVLTQALDLTFEERKQHSASTKAASKQFRRNVARVETILNQFHVVPEDNYTTQRIVEFVTRYPRLAELAKADPKLLKLLRAANIDNYTRANEDLILAYLQHFPDTDAEGLRRIIRLDPTQSRHALYYVDRGRDFIEWLTQADRVNEEGHQDLFGGIKRIYGDQIDEEMLKRLIANPFLVGAKLKDIHAVEARYAKDIDPNSPNLNQLIAVFGSQTPQWVRRFDSAHVLDGRPIPNTSVVRDRPNMARQIIHDAMQCLPKFNNRRQVQGLGPFLLSQSSVTRPVRMIAQNWARLTPEEHALVAQNPKDAITPIMGRLLNIPPDKLHLQPLYMEANQWGASPTMEARHRFHGDDRSTSTTLADLYERSLSVPLPAWTNVSVQKYGYTGHFLPREDARGLFLGQYTNCCQHPNGEGSSCAFHGQASPTSAFFVVEDSHGDIVAQSWAWQSRDGGVVFDNVEAKGLGKRAIIVRDIYTEAAQQMMLQGVKYVNVGTGYSDMDLHGLESVPRAKAEGGLHGVYTDAGKQVRFPAPSLDPIIKGELDAPAVQTARTMRAITIRLAARAIELEEAGESHRADLIDRALIQFAEGY